MKLPKELTTVTPLSTITILVVFVGLILIGFLFGIIYKESDDYGKNQNPPTQIIPPKPTSTLDVNREPTGSAETANWKTYSSIQHNYSVKYPPNLEVNELTSFLSTSDKRIDAVFKTDDGFLKIVNYVKGRGVSTIRTENIIIAGINTVKFYESKTSVIIKAIRNPINQEVGFEYTLSKDKEKAAKEDELFDQILSTFRFLP